MAEKARNEGHIVMTPFMAHGHLIPFLALATQIQQKTSFTITIATTPLNIQHLKSAISTTFSNSSTINLHLAELPLNSTQHGLHPNMDNTGKVPLTDFIKLFHASLSLEAPLRSLIAQITQEEGHPPLCIISDVLFGWVHKVSKSCGIRSITFTTCGAYGTLAYMSIWLNLPHKKTDSDEFFLPGFPQTHRFHRSQMHKLVREADGGDVLSRYLVPQFALSMNSDGWICNTVEKIEPFGLNLLRNYVKLPVWSVGPLLPPSAFKGSLVQAPSASGLVTVVDSGGGYTSLKGTSKQHAGKELGMELEECIEWLDSKDESSVLYISFGSQNSISASQMMSLAEGLEESGKKFIWILRPPFGFDMNGDFRGGEW